MDGLVGSARGSIDSGFLDLLEGKLAVLRFQIKIREELEALASRSEVLPATSDSVPNGLVPERSSATDANIANAAQEKAKELSSDVKSITQLYNEYAVPFELWEVLSFSLWLLIVHLWSLLSFTFFVMIDLYLIRFFFCSYVSLTCQSLSQWANWFTQYFFKV